MKYDKEFIEKVQRLLDQGNTMNKAAEIMEVHHSKINRLYNKGLLELYTAFDEEVDKRHLYQNFEWLWEEDKLEVMLYSAFDGWYILNKTHDEDVLRVGQYVKKNYKTLRHYFKIKGFSMVMDQVEINCNCCGGKDNLSNWHTDISKPWGLYHNCPECRLNTQKKYYLNNPQKFFESQQLRRELSEALPVITLTKKEWMNKRAAFGWKCALSKGVENISMDHFIPICTGHAGTYFENLVPLTRSLNSTKNGFNPFRMVDRHECSVESFEKVIDHLAEINCLTNGEYTAFVNWCFDNIRVIDEVNDDPRHSIEIWREDTGIQFPLPSYVYKSRLNVIRTPSVIGNEN